MRVVSIGLVLAVLGSIAAAAPDVPPAARAAFDKAEIAREESRFNAAAGLYRQAIDAHPLYLKAHAGYLAALRGMGDFYEAQALYDRLVTDHPDAVDLKVFRAAALDREAAPAALAELAKSHPGNERAAVELARAHLAVGDHKKAEKAAKAALKINSDSKLARVFLGDAYFARKKYKSARKWYDGALELDSAYVPALLRTALAWQADGKPGKGVDLLTKLLSEDNLPNLAAGHWTLALIRARTGDFEGAITSLDQVIQISQGDLEATMAKGHVLLMQKKPGLAAQVYAKVAEKREGMSEALFCLGWAHEVSADAPEIKDAERKKRLQAAAAAYEKCAAIDPGVRPRDSLGFVHLLGQEHQKAITQFKRATDIDPKFAPAMNNLGLADDMADNRSMAKKRYERVLSKIDKQNVRAHVMLALDLWLDKSHNKAIKELDKALKIDPEDDLAWTFLGDIQYDFGKPDRAIKAYKKAVGINDQNFMAWYHMGIAYDDDKRKDEEADRCYRKALEAKADPPPDMLLRLAIVNDDTALDRLEEALKFYQLYRDLGGDAEWVPERIEQLTELLSDDG